MTPLGLARKIEKLPERAAITRRFEDVLTARGIWDPERERKKYSSQNSIGSVGFRNMTVLDIITARTKKFVRLR
jgi:hypothetical protein